MKLLYSTSSPFVRKVSLVSKALGLDDAIEKLPSAANPLQRDPRITQFNPLGKVPTLLTDDGMVLADSKLIAEYLCAQVPGNAVLPAQGEARWKALRLQALADGMLEAALVVRYETFTRPPELRWTAWSDAQMLKVDATLAQLESELNAPVEDLSLGVIATVCALGYLDFRFAQWDWRGRYPQLAGNLAPIFAHPDVLATLPFVPAPK